jgi:chemotaxis protein CheZ
MNETPPTTIITAEENTSSLYAMALEEILIGLGHGDASLVEQALKKLGNGAEIDRIGDRAAQILRSFHETVWSLREGLDPSAVTMTSTNIPDAAKKLGDVLTSTNEATHKLLALVEHQEALIKKGDTYLSELEENIQHNPSAPTFVKEFAARYRELNSEARALASEMVMTQEFQDLCGQALKKVLTLVQGLESRMTSLLEHLKIDIPSTQHTEQAEPLTQQGDVDDLLKDLGF